MRYCRTIKDIRLVYEAMLWWMRVGMEAQCSVSHLSQRGG
jgi:hypothetical protein